MSNPAETAKDRSRESVSSESTTMDFICNLHSEEVLPFLYGFIRIPYRWATLHQTEKNIIFSNNTGKW
jgi:hypothetical protein